MYLKNTTQKNESSLLEFDASDNTDDDDDDEYVQDEDNMSSILKSIDDTDEEDEDDDYNNIPSSKIFKQQQQQKQSMNKFLLTPLRLQQLEQGAFNSHSIKGLKRIVYAYGTAAHLSDANSQQDDGGDSSDDDDDGGGRRGGGEKKKKKKEFQITSPVVFDSLMVGCLVNCHEEFYYHLLREEEEEDESEESGSSSSSSDSEASDSNDDDEKDAKQSTKNKASSKKKEKEEATNKKTTIDNNKPLHPKTLSKSPNWSSLQPIIESFVKSTLHVLSESGKQPKLLQFVLSSLQHYTPYLTALNPKIGKSYLKTLVSLWSTVQDNSQEYNTVRLQAFLRIRQLAITQPYPYIEDVLKQTYLAYAQRTKFGTGSYVSTILLTLTFMANSIVELYTLDYATSYQFGFVYIRQLALLLRSGIMKQNGEELGKVCCWQYVHCLRLWVAVLCAACGGSSTSSIKQDQQHDGGEEGNNNNNNDGASSKKLGGGPNNNNKDEESNMLHSLVYPLTEIILGVTRLSVSNNVRYVPLRLHCVRLLQQLAACTETFIPTTSLLLGVLDLKEVGMKPLRDGGKNKKKNKNKNKGGGGGSGTIRGLRLPLILKLPKENTLRTMEQLDSVLKETFVLLNREVDMYRYSPGFPEFTFAILQRLRKVSC